MKLTVITPSFNQGEYIEKTIRSVLDQDWEGELEYFVIDAGSTDETSEIIRRYEDRIAWWVSEPDEGQTDALNKGLRRATGDVVAYINSDDHYLPGAFAAAARGFKESGASWVVGACRFDDPAGVHNGTWRPELPTGPRRSWIFDPWGVPQPSSFWRRELFERFGPFREDMHFSFDTEHALRLVMEDEMPGLVEEELAVRYLQPGAKSIDKKPFEMERRRLVDLYAGRLPAGERARLRLARVARSLRVFDLFSPADVARDPLRR